MPGLLGIAASGMRAHQLRLDIIANNMANVNTVGYKSARVEFQDAGYELKIVTAGSGDVEATTEAWLGNGVTSGSRRVLIQGAIQQTGVMSEMAISGDGFFQVGLADGALAYTRDGSFSVDLNGQLVTHNGNFLEPPVTLPAGAVDMRIASDGQVTATAAVISPARSTLDRSSMPLRIVPKVPAPGVPTAGSPDAAVGTNRFNPIASSPVGFAN